MKIRAKFSIASALVVFVVISALAFSTYYLVNSTLQQTTKAYIEDNTTLLSSSIDNWLAGKKAQIAILQSTLDSDFSADKFQYALENPAYSKDFSLMFGTLETERGLRSNNPNRVNPPEIDFKERAWYQQAKAGKEVLFTPPYVDAATKELILSVVAPIKTAGQIRGVIGGDLSLADIANSVNTINFNHTGFAFIADKNGTIITHPNASLNGKTTQSIYGISPKQSNRIIDIEHNGEDELVYFQQLPGKSGVAWSVGVVLNKDKVYASLSTFTQTTIVIAIISIALCGFLLRNLAKRLLSPLDDLESAIGKIASGGGDLTQRLTIVSDDECGAVARNFNQFLESLQSLVRDVTAKAQNVVTRSNDVNELSTKSSTALNDQFTLIDSLATAMNEMSSTSSDIAASAQDAATLVTEVNESTESSQALFQQTTHDVFALSEAISSSQDLSNQLAEYSNNIEQILSVINGIAEQTNLLALNAAIEAARAGEQGRGFAVVADEVRTLASRTQESITEIKNMIDQIQHYSNLVQKSMSESKHNAIDSAKQTEQARDALISISQSVKEIMDRNIQIAAAIEQQTVVTEDINRTTTTIKDISTEVDSFAKSQYEDSNELLQDVQGQQRLLDKFVV